ncbi:hypothetical protein [Plantactinospora sp. GCM10030261]|uniref:hypothetical protein n=1 Tax=Plantactinospora sp. GCM10030261 TaxID=3273420 RepID=UPI00360FC389
MLLAYAGQPLHGIAGASAINMTMFVFFLVGGVVLAVREASGRHLWHVLVRPPLIATVPALGCWVVVILLRQAILAREPLAETVWQDGLGRALAVFQLVSVVGVVAETVCWVVRRVAAARPRRSG